MALTLEKINNSKKTTTVKSDEKKNIRPWKTSNELGNSFSGTMAAKKAKEIIEKNNFIIDQIRLEGASEKSVNSIEDLIRKKEYEFENLENKEINMRQIASSASLFSRVKSLIIGH